MHIWDNFVKSKTQKIEVLGYNRQANPSREIPRLLLLRMIQKNRGKSGKIGENLREQSWANTAGGSRVEFSFWAIDRPFNHPSPSDSAAFSP
ncbi:hypothetical protein J0895_20460 [Phormidium pseudopriestleyi FRX01]|uniref:Uncharacterized protein n=1 Tax=Phormidium pseudopriestleyi FRX01 TaxID=1759528 RepID=A0ABS3FX63_9CYAN|nr:hypothetical protein [Phormidium pseudopriestleyi]MBO0351407.1 hypothetical protein [Phormidium pseudopriestleyi FRX01]